jgi:hypothetical protein
MRRMEAKRKNAKAFRWWHSQSLAKRRQRLSQAMVRSTIHRLGKIAKPFAISERLTISTSILPEDFANGGLKDRPLIAAVGIELQQEWMQAKQCGHHQHPTATILDIRRMHEGVEQQALSID